MYSHFTENDVGVVRFAAATVVAAVFVAVSLGVQGCATSGGSGTDGGDMLPAADADAIQSESQPADGVAEVRNDAAPAAAAAADDDEDITHLPNVIKAADGDTGIFETEESASAKSKFNPLIGQGYRLKVTVMVGDKNEVGPMEVMVSEKEEITLPLVGRIPCGGLTIEALHSRLSGRYAEFFADPEVIVSFAYSDDGISPYGQVLVQGRVHREGWVNIPPTRNLRLRHAIQRCGGFSSSALRRKVLVTRQDEEGNMQRIIVDFTAIGKNGALDKDIILEPNDVVYVDESNF